MDLIKMFRAKQKPPPMYQTTSYQYENVKMKSTHSSSNDTVSENNQTMETDDVRKCDIALETDEVKAEVPEQEQTENADLDDIRLVSVKSRRGRPKATKTPFWNFSKKKSVANKQKKKKGERKS